MIPFNSSPNKTTVMETKKILVPTDFSESAYRALLHAAALAEQTGAEVHLVHIVQYSAISMMRAPEINLIVPSSYSFFWETKKQQMETISRWVRQQYNISIYTTIQEGSITKELVQYTFQNNIDLIILHDTSSKTWWSRLFKDRTKAIQKRVSVPVITILAAAEKPFNWNDVVIPVTDTVPEARIRTIAAFADKFRITIHIVALQVLGKAKKPLSIMMNSLYAIRSKCNAPVICRELNGEGLHDAARKYAEKIHANALIENNGHCSKPKGLLIRIADYFEKTDYPYITPGAI
jgi:nucleotide-binding universal stress UspA family protein